MDDAVSSMSSGLPSTCSVEAGLTDLFSELWATETGISGEADLAHEHHSFFCDFSGDGSPSRYVTLNFYQPSGVYLDDIQRGYFRPCTKKNLVFQSY